MVTANMKAELSPPDLDWSVPRRGFQENLVAVREPRPRCFVDTFEIFTAQICNSLLAFKGYFL